MISSTRSMLQVAKAGILPGDLSPTIDKVAACLRQMTSWEPSTDGADRLKSFDRECGTRTGRAIQALSALGLNVRGRFGSIDPLKDRKKSAKGQKGRRRGNPGLKPKVRAKMIADYNAWLESGMRTMADFARSRGYFGKADVDDAVNYIRACHKHWKAANGGLNRAA